MNSIKTLFLSVRPFIITALMGLFLQDPIIMPDFDMPDDTDKQIKNYNVLVIDDGGSGFDIKDSFINKVLKTSPGKCLLYTSSTDKDYIASFIPGGIGGIVSQTAAPEELKAGIKSVARSDRFYCGEIEKALFNNGRHELLKTLTLREKEILFFTKEGKTSKEISQLFGISVKTVGSHKENIKSKLGLQRVNELYRI